MTACRLTKLAFIKVNDRLVFGYGERKSVGEDLTKDDVLPAVNTMFCAANFLQAELHVDLHEHSEDMLCRFDVSLLFQVLTYLFDRKDTVQVVDHVVDGIFK